MVQLEMNTFVKNVLEPLVGRIGTFIGGVLLTYGVGVEHANLIGMGAASAIFVSIDLVTRKIWLERNNGK